MTEILEVIAMLAWTMLRSGLDVQKLKESRSSRDTRVELLAHSLEPSVGDHLG